MKLEDFNNLVSLVKESKLVLVGLGEEWVLTGDDMISYLATENPKIALLYELAYSNVKYERCVPVLECYFWEHFIPDNIRGAYEKLAEVLEGKNYFIVSLTIDTYLEQFGFKMDRVVQPCGTVSFFQCEKNCNDALYENGKFFDALNTLIGEWKENENPSVILDMVLSLISQQTCSHCGSALVLNSLDSKVYCEKGYLDKWQTYMKWLTGTVNKELCILEAGVGLQLASVIRWPFEKTLLYNQKAKMVRIHKSFSQANEDTSDRTFSCAENAVAFLAK